MKTIDYQIIHDRDLPLVFVGRSYHSTTLYQLLKNYRTCFHVSFEDIKKVDTTWIREHQFICCNSNIDFKMQVVNFLNEKSAHFFSIISTNTVIGNGIHIGNGVMINHFNVIYDNNLISDHSCITNHVTLSHEVSIGSFCHISPYTYMSFTDLARGNYVGLRSGFFGYPERRICTAEFCNFQTDSRLTQPVNYSGTWFGNRLTDKRTSLELAL